MMKDTFGNGMIEFIEGTGSFERHVSPFCLHACCPASDFPRLAFVCRRGPAGCLLPSRDSPAPHVHHGYFDHHTRHGGARAGRIFCRERRSAPDLGQVHAGRFRFLPSHGDRGQLRHPFERQNEGRSRDPVRRYADGGRTSSNLRVGCPCPSRWRRRRCFFAGKTELASVAPLSPLMAGMSTASSSTWV